MSHLVADWCRSRRFPIIPLPLTERVNMQRSKVKVKVEYSLYQYFVLIFLSDVNINDYD